MLTGKSLQHVSLPLIVSGQCPGGRSIHSLLVLQYLSFAVASYADALQARHAILLPHVCGGGELAWRAQRASAEEAIFAATSLQLLPRLPLENGPLINNWRMVYIKSHVILEISQNLIHTVHRCLCLCFIDILIVLARYFCVTISIFLKIIML